MSSLFSLEEMLLFVRLLLLLVFEEGQSDAFIGVGGSSSSSFPRENIIAFSVPPLSKRMEYSSCGRIPRVNRGEKERGREYTCINFRREDGLSLSGLFLSLSLFSRVLRARF